MTRTVSIGWELDQIRSAVEAARLLIDHLAHKHLLDDYSQRVAAPAAAAVMWLVDARMLDLGRVLRGELDPERLRSPTNAKEDLGDDDPDLYLKAWSLDQVQAELERIQRQMIDDE